MKAPYPAIDLDSTRRSVVRKLREVRLARGWSQAELAAKLGLSQARLSVIERGGGTISAEQFVAFLALANVSIEEFLPPTNADAAFQNALARLGAHGLREDPGTLPSSRLATARDAIREVLVSPDSPRLVAALAPVLVWNIDGLNLHALHQDLAELGLGQRLGWMADNVRAALDLPGARAPRLWALRERIARVELDRFIALVDPRAAPDPREPAPDRFDTHIASARTVKDVEEASSDVSRRWRVLTVLQPADFREALDAAHTPG